MRAPRSEGRSLAVVGAVVVTLKVTVPEALACWGEGVHRDSVRVGGSVQVKLTVPEKPLASVRVNVAFALDPCATWKLAFVGVKVNGVVTVNAMADGVG